MIDTPPTIRTGSQQALRAFFRAAIPPRILSFSEWLTSKLIAPAGPYKNQRITFQTQPWVRLFAEEVSSGRWKRFATTGPVQSGKSLICFVAPILYYLFEVGEKVICGIPDLGMVTVKWKEDIKPAIESSGYGEFLSGTGKGSRGGSPTYIEFLNGTALQFMGGGGNDKQRAGATTRVMCITETDGMDDVGATSDEGTKIDQLLGRLRSYGDRAVAFAECSVTHEKGYIWKEYQAGTASRIACPCPHCDAFVTPERDDLVGWQDATNEIEAGLQAAFACPDCGGFIREDDRAAMNELAILVHRGQWIENGEVKGDLPATNTLGFRWSAFNNLFASTEQLGREEWRAAQAEDQETVQITRKQQVWCLPSETEDVEKADLTRGIAQGSAPGYAGRVIGLDRGLWPEDTLYRVAMVDVHKRNLRWKLLAARSNGQKHVVDYGAWETESPDVVGEETAIREAILALCPLLHQDNALTVGLVDCGNWVDTVQDAVQASGAPWICSHGANKFQMPPVTTATRIRNRHAERWFLTRPKPGVHVVTMDPDYWKHLVHSDLLIKPLTADGKPAPGSITLFGANPRDHHAWATEILAETWERRFVVAKGFKESWVKHSKNNHSLDLMYGCLCACDIAEAAAAEAEEIEATVVETPAPSPQFVGDRPPEAERIAPTPRPSSSWRKKRR